MTQIHQYIGNSGNGQTPRAEGPGVRSVNLHINGLCNYKCKFCFARNLARGTMTPAEWSPYLESLRSKGITKINFAGGEPTLHPQFIELCGLAKDMGFTVSVVTNGSMIDRELMEKMVGRVDWIGLSVDSPDNETEKLLGRQCGGADHIENVVKVAKMAHENGVKVKLNITVVRQSWSHDFTELIKRVDPERVKAFQVVRVEGENEEHYDECSVTEEQWGRFRKNHSNIILKNGGGMVFEGGSDMIDSYLMLDPRGMIMKNSGNRQDFLPFSLIDEDGLNAAVDPEKYLGRGAVYGWEGEA